ncbi:hypothetical protein D088_190005 [Salmonella enterica subsp. houtenae serovar 16:z4,z32:-- str. RKS3027]|nr:hypothetical protein D088_190005 [Salmonella enterica subsp. houtenae serovar 16:z4,z32:-- str. RKS3027]
MPEFIHLSARHFTARHLWCLYYCSGKYIQVMFPLQTRGS